MTNHGSWKKGSITNENERCKEVGFKDSTKMVDVKLAKDGGLMEATAKLKAKGLKDGGMVVKDKIVAIDTSPNSGLITVKGFGVGRRT